jgi:hypothetical protein
MDRRLGFLVVWPLLLLPLTSGCQSPYRSDQGALAGGLLGAGTGAIVGSAVGNAGAGAAIGAGVGALSGALVGNELDQMDARNRAMIAQQLGRQAPVGAASVQDVVAMTRAGVNEELIVNHVRIHGMAAPLQAPDLIMLQQQGVSTRVIAAMQAPPVLVQQAPVAYQGTPTPVVYQQPAPQPVIVDPYWGPPWNCGYYYRYPHYHPGPRLGVTIGN